MHHPDIAYLRQIVKQSDPKAEYKVLANIGSGTYGDVYKAIHRETRQVVAIKVMKIDPKDDIRSICQEIHTLLECSHENIVRYFGSYLRANKLWICMEYCGGQSMQDIYLYTRRPLDEECIAFVTRETLRGVKHMHSLNRIHRDIKGANILLTDAGCVKIADFGVAAKLSSSMVRRCTVIGTPYWMAPEVASVDSRGSGYDSKCDIWAVGITAIEYAELQPPLFDMDPLMALQLLGTRNYKPPTLKNRSQWSNRFRSFVKSALTKSERLRPDAATLLNHEFVTNPSLSVRLTCQLLDMKRAMEAREMEALKAPPPVAQVRAPNPALPPKLIPQMEPSTAQPREVPPNAFVHADGNGQHKAPEYVSAANMDNHFQPSDSGYPLPPRPAPPTDHAPLRALAGGGVNGDGGHSAASGEKPVAVAMRISSLRRDESKAVQPPLPSGPRAFPELRILPEYCLDQSHEDLVTEVFDELQKRHSRLNYPEDNHLAMLERDTNRLSFYEGEEYPEPNDVTNFMCTDSSGDSPTLTPPDVSRSRSKRQAPLPPPLPPKGEPTRMSAYRQASSTAPGPLTSDVPCSTADVPPLSPSDAANRRSLVPPPRPPPPKFPGRRSPAALPQASPTAPSAHSREQQLRAEQHSQMERGIGLPPVPKVYMGACFSLIFEGCPLKVNATATWVNPSTNAQVIIFGTNDGIYCMDLQELADATLELLIPRRCIWLTIFKDTMMSLSGKTPHLYSHNLVNVMKAKCQDPQVSGSLTGRLPHKLLPKRFQPTVKVPNTRGCHIASVIRNLNNGNKYLCAVVEKTIILMEWFNPRKTFVEVKRVEVPSMPSPVYYFDLIFNPEQDYPSVCLGVYGTSDPSRYRLHVVDLNDRGPDYSTMPPDEHPLPIVKVAHVYSDTLMICFQEHVKFVNLRGNVIRNQQGIDRIPFDVTVNSVVCLEDGILAFHSHGLKGFGFDGQLTQDINDAQHIYQLLGSDKNIVVESRPTDDPMSTSNIYLLFGHESCF
ncbi:Mitogen-activated protein kinase kinase kinase kinase 1 [Sparganum proliferum]